MVVALNLELTKFAVMIDRVLVPMRECPLNGDDLFNNVRSKLHAVRLVQWERAADLELGSTKSCNWQSGQRKRDGKVRIKLVD